MVPGRSSQGAIEHLAQAIRRCADQGDQPPPCRTRAVMASAGATQEGSKALLQFGTHRVGCAVGNLLDPVGE